MTYETLSCDLSEQILTITLNRPDKLNAFTVTMANELISAFNAASENDDVRVIIVTGAGRAFCAGMDLAVSGNVFGLDETQHPTMKDMNERLEDPVIVKGVRDTGGRVSLAIFNCKKTRHWRYQWRRSRCRCHHAVGDGYTLSLRTR